MSAELARVRVEDGAEAPAGAGAAVRSAQPLLVFHLAGTQEEMGRQHGAMVRALGDWEEVIDYYQRMPEYILSGSISPLVIKTAGRLALGGLIEALERGRAPDLRARNKAFMEALGLPARYSRYTFIMDVLQNIVGLHDRVGLAARARAIGQAIPPACSTLAAWGGATEDGRLLHGRNFDFPGVGVWERRPAVVFCAPTGGMRYGFVTVRGGDVPGVSTFNEAGLSITTHTRFHRGVTLRGVGIIDLVHEITRSARSIDDAIRIAQRGPVASSWGIYVASAKEKRAVVIETAGRLIEVVEPQAGEEFLACTNRYRHPRLKVDEVTISPAFVANSDGREAAVRRVGVAGNIDVAAIQALLGSHDEACAPGRERAAGSVVAQPTSVQSIVIDAEREALHVSVGPCPTGGGPWVEVPMAWGEGPGFHTLRVAPQATTSHASRFHEVRRHEARAAYIEAVAVENRGLPHERALAHMERAVALDPDDPTYRFLAGALCLRLDRLTQARAHLRAALAVDQAPFYRGQALLWASRAALLDGAADEAESLRRALLGIDDPLLAPYHKAARADAAGGAPTREQLRKLPVRLHLVDAGVWA